MELTAMENTQNQVHPIFQPLIDSLMYSPYRVYTKTADENKTESENKNNSERKN
jgi:hypothetical protein